MTATIEVTRWRELGSFSESYQRSLRKTALRRTPLDILYDIVNSALAPRNQTNIMYACNINLKMLRQYLPMLTANGYLEYQGLPKLYVATGKGRAFVKRYDEVARLRSSLKVAFDALQDDMSLLGRRQQPGLA